MSQLAVTGNVGTLLVAGDDDNPVSTLIQNVDTANTLYLGTGTNVSPDNPLLNTPLLPGQSTVADGTQNVFGIADKGQVVQINVMPGFTSFFQPTNLSTLGGVSIYVQTVAPTPPIAINSLWFSPNGAINIWNGSAWVPQTFSGQQIISANTIFAAQLAAGIIYAGIVDGTVVKAATFIGGVSLYYSGPNPALGTLIGSAGATVTTVDGVGNTVYPGFVSYVPTVGSGTPRIVAQHTAAGINLGTPAQITGAGGATSGGMSGSGAPGGQNTLTSGTVNGADTAALMQMGSASSGLPAGGGPAVQVQGYVDLLPIALPTATGPYLYTSLAGGPAVKSQGINGIIPVTQANFTSFVNTTTSMNQMSFLWPIPFIDFYNNVVYRLRAWGHGVQGSTQQQINTQISAFGLTFAGTNMPATDIPASAAFHWRYEIDVIVNAGGNGIIYGGSFTWSQAAVTANRGTAAIDGNSSPLPGGNTNMALQMGWGAIVGGPTITSACSTFERLAA